MADSSSATASTADNKAEAQHSDSHPSATHSSPVKTWPTIDNDELDEWCTYNYPHINTEIESEEMLHKMCPKYEQSGRLAPVPPKMTKTMTKGNSTSCGYLNQVSAALQNNDTPYSIKFLSKETKEPVDHTTGTECYPGIVAIREYPASACQIPPENLTWSHLEATGEEGSGKSRDAEEAQAGCYTSYHLQARPDLVSVAGIWVGKSSFKLFVSDACRVYHTPAVQWTDPMARRLLYAWVWRLYHPEVDPSITIDVTTNQPTFTIKTIDGTEYGGLVVLRAGESIGRRTMVLAQPDPGSSIVIKEQYIENDRRFMEGPILQKIHKGGRFPGVVRPDRCEYVMNGNERISVEYGGTKERKLVDKITRSKIRLVLKDRGTRLMDVKTPRELLMAMYDLLEISRVLFTKRQILHRDISPGNILLADSSAISTGKDLGDMCFSEYLLSESAGQDHSSLSDHRQRLTTRVIVIDFDSGEDQDPNDPTKGEPKDRTGTPVFMARMVRSNKYPAGLYKLPSMPAVAPELLPRYQSTLMARLNKLPPNTEEVIKIPSGAMVPPNKFRHLLRYDAESVFWYLLFWCIEAQPAGKLPEENISHSAWSNLVGEDDMRDAGFIRVFPEGCLHSSYSGSEKLLDDMRKHLQGDLDFSDNEQRKENPEYIHEVFQRLILNFLVANNTKPFMVLEKDDKPRGVKSMGMARTTPSTKRSYNVYTDNSEDEPTQSKQQYK